MIARSSVLGLVLTGLALAQAQRAGQQAVVPPPQRFGQVDERMHRGMQGMWKIEKAEWGFERYQGPDIDGFMLIEDGHLAFQLQASAYDDRGSESLIFQSELARYRFTPVGEIELITLIGADNLEPGAQGQITSLPPGDSRRYRVRLAGDALFFDSKEARISLRRVVGPKPPFSERMEPAKAAPSDGTPPANEE